MRLIVISAVWCPSCLVMKKVIKQIAEHIEVVKYDYDLDEEEVKKYNVGQNLPVFIYEKDGKEVSRVVGETTYLFLFHVMFMLLTIHMLMKQLVL